MSLTCMKLEQGTLHAKIYVGGFMREGINFTVELNLVDTHYGQNTRTIPLPIQVNNNHFHIDTNKLIFDVGMELKNHYGFDKEKTTEFLNDFMYEVGRLSFMLSKPG